MTKKKDRTKFVDDCSTGNTQARLALFMEQDSRIHYHCLGINSGAAVARIESMRLVREVYIAFWDSDDL